PGACAAGTPPLAGRDVRRLAAEGGRRARAPDAALVLRHRLLPMEAAAPRPRRLDARNAAHHARPGRCAVALVFHQRKGHAMSKFLFVMIEGGGNVPAQLAVARRLIARGHEVRVLGDPTISDEVQHIGASFAAYRRAPHLNMRSREWSLEVDWEA